MSFRLAVLITGFALLPATAFASARDDVMAGSARCAAVAQGRDWLNCYYGAAQPMRDELGLSAAPAAQTSLVPRPTAIQMAAPAQGGARDVVMSGSARCAAIGDNRLWLDCYYGAAQPMRAELGLIPAAQSQTALAATPSRPLAVQPAPPVNSAVLYAPKKTKGGVMASILGGAQLTPKMALASYKFDSYGIFTVTLSDGGVWKQSPDDSNFARWKKAPATYRATISQGAFSSFNMRIDGDRNVYKVHPVSPG